MDTLEAISARKSVRAFVERQIPKELILKLLNYARLAPSGVNTQPWNVVIVNKPIIKSLGDLIINNIENGVTKNPDYKYYPELWYEPYANRRKACGAALYQQLNIDYADKTARKQQWYKNYYFFGAPIGIFIFIDKNLELGSWLDTGMFIQNIMLAAQGLGLATCPQASMAEFPDIIRQELDISVQYKLVCGIALGYEDVTDLVNQYRTTREPVANFAEFKF